MFLILPGIACTQLGPNVTELSDLCEDVDWTDPVVALGSVVSVPELGVEGLFRPPRLEYRPLLSIPFKVIPWDAETNVCGLEPLPPESSSVRPVLP